MNSMTVIPSSFYIAGRGRIAEFCSMPETITVWDLESVPLITRLRDWVAPGVKINLDASAKPKSSAASFLAA